MSDLTFDERLAALEEAVAAMPRRGRGLPRAEQALRKAALQYARMVTDGWFMDADGFRISVCHADRKNYEDAFVLEMKSAARDLLRELGVEERAADQRGGR